MNKKPYRSPESESHREALPEKRELDSARRSKDLREAAIAGLVSLLASAVIALLSVAVYNA